MTRSVEVRDSRAPNLYEREYAHDRRHRCQCCRRIIEAGERVVMWRIQGGTRALHIECASKDTFLLADKGQVFTHRQLAQLHVDEYARRCGWKIPEARAALSSGHTVSASYKVMRGPHLMGVLRNGPRGWRFFPVFAHRRPSTKDYAVKEDAIPSWASGPGPDWTQVKLIEVPRRGQARMKTSVHLDDGEWKVRVTDFSGQGFELTCTCQEHAQDLAGELELCTWLDEYNDPLTGEEVK